MNSNTLIFCTDIERPFIYGTLFEMLYQFSKNKQACTVAFILGDRQAARFDKIAAVISKHFPLVTSVIARNGTQNMNTKFVEEARAFAEESVSGLQHIDDLKGLTFQEFDIGIPVSSSLVSRLTCPEPSISENRTMIYWYLFYSALTFLEGREIIEQVSPDMLYVYNGRFYNTYPLTLFSERINTVYYERIDQRRRLRIQPHRIHDCIGNGQLALEHFESHPVELSTKIGREFFHTQKNVFFDNDRKTFNAPKEKKLLTYITTSDDEFESLHPEIAAHTLFSSQKEAARYLMDWVAEHDDYELIIRAHPNIKNKSRNQQQYWNALNGRNTTVIKYDSEVDTYDLIEKSDVIIGYRSTTLLEATYMGKPTILVSVANYTGHDVCYEPGSLEALDKLLQTIPAPKPAGNALIWAFFMRSYGLPFEYLHSLGYSSFDELETALFACDVA